MLYASLTFDQVLVKQYFVLPPSGLNVPISGGTLQVIYLKYDEHYSQGSLPARTYLGESAVVEQVLHDHQVHLHRSSLAAPILVRLSKANLVAAKDFS